MKMKAVHFQIDNTTALMYLLKMGGEGGGTGNKRPLDLAKDIWDYIMKNGISRISAEYLPSCLNVEADWQSRNTRDSSEWKLFPQIFHQICQMKGTPEIDLFASRLSHQLPKYFAWRPNPYSQGTDAMQHSWGSKYLYAVPPFSMINKALNKVKQDKVGEMLLVAPTCQSQTWYQILLRMSIEKPILLPQYQYLLTSIQLISSMRRPGSISNYNSSCAQWVSWCNERKVDPFRCDINQVANHLMQGFSARLLDVTGHLLLPIMSILTENLLVSTQKCVPY